MEVLKEHKGKVFTSALISIIGVGLDVVPYFSVANIINNIVEGKVEIGAYIPYILAVLVGLLGSILFHELSTIISHNLAYGVIEGKRKKLVDKLSKISMGEIEKRSSGQWSQFMVETLDKMEQPIAHVIPEVIANLLIPIVLVVIIFIMDWRIGVANLLTIPLGLLFFMMMMRGYEEKSKRYQEASKAMNTTMVEYVNGIKVIKAFNKSASSFGKFKETVNENKKAMLDWYLSVCFSMTGAMETIPATMIFVLPTSLYLFMQGSVEMSLLIMCILLSYASYKPLIKAMSHLETMANIKIVMKEINKVMEIPDLERGKQLKHIKSYDVEFQNVSFAYDESKNVLNNISFKANEKELTAIVGDSGGGKSTIAKLIAGFWNIDKGKILIGDVDLNDMPLKQNMELITYVSQENFLFNKTILENLRVAKEDASMDEIKEACVKASCHDFIMSLPEKYETLIGEGGANLSGGERQRISIARAMMKNAPILILDEATAYTDPENEAIIQKSVSELSKGKTLIVIAHRLSTIIDSDQIVVINAGNVEAKGTHTELLESCELYRNMWDAHVYAKDVDEMEGGTLA